VLEFIYQYQPLSTGSLNTVRDPLGLKQKLYCIRFFFLPRTVGYVHPFPPNAEKSANKEK
jgi:hypothetical protein